MDCLSEENNSRSYFILGHLSRENNTPAKAFSAVSEALSGRGVQIYVAPEAERFSLEIGGKAK